MSRKNKAHHFRQHLLLWTDIVIDDFVMNSASCMVARFMRFYYVACTQPVNLCRVLSGYPEDFDILSSKNRIFQVKNLLLTNLDRCSTQFSFQHKIKESKNSDKYFFHGFWNCIGGQISALQTASNENSLNCDCLDTTFKFNCNISILKRKKSINATSVW